MGHLAYKTILGTLNPADALTKHVPGLLLDSHLQAVGVGIKEGRAETAPTLDAVTPAYAAQGIETAADELDGARRVTICPTARAHKTVASRLCKGSLADETD